MDSYGQGDYSSGRNFDDLDIESCDANQFPDNIKVNPVYTPEEKYLFDNCTVKLEDGQHGYVFSCRNDGGGNRSFCHICQTSLVGWPDVNKHISGMNHTTAMQKSCHPRHLFSRIVEEDTKVKLVPGEPAPPGMEDMVEIPRCVIQSTLDAYTEKPLIGLEYLVEVHEGEIEPKYYCLLCNKQGSPFTILTHLTSLAHYNKYLQKYFSLTYTAVKLVPKTNEYKKGLTITMTRILAKIEKKYGRLKPRQFDGVSFLDEKSNLIEKIDSEFHFRETSEDDYFNMVDWGEIKKLAFVNEDDDVVLISSIPKKAKKKKTEKQESSNPSKFNKNSRINVEKQNLRKGDEKKISPEKDNYEVIVIDDDIKKPKDSKGVSNRSSVSSSSRKSRSPHYFRSRRFGFRTRPKSHRSRSCSRTRSHSRSPFSSRRRSPFNSHLRNSRNHSPVRKGHVDDRSKYNRPRMRSNERRHHERSGMRPHSRSRSRSRDHPKHRSNRSPVLPYPKRRRSHSKSPRSRSPFKPRYLRDVIEMKSRSDDPSILADEAPTKYKWDKFREEFQLFSETLNDKLSYYKKNPEKHPKYPEEWKMFWNRRYKELQNEGKDPGKHDFKPEWIVFWNQRMKELHDEELKAGMETIKLKLDLNDTKETASFNSSSVDRKDVTVDDIKNTWKALTGSDIKETIKNNDNKEHIKLKDDVDLLSDENFEKLRNQSHLQSRIPPPGVRQGFVPYDDNAPRVISVLRMISVLESQLGSLGPKVVSLLSKAIAMEKTCKGSSQDLLCDEDQCVLFETVREKLKGVLYAGLVERNFVNLTKVALNNIGDLFRSAPKVTKKEKPITNPHSAASASISSNPVTVPGVGTVDRVAIAQQIAGALVAQGKTDVSEVELEVLINAVVGMAEASINSGTQITTAEYLQKIKMIDINPNSKTVESEGLQMLQNYGNDSRDSSELINIHNLSNDLDDADLKYMILNFKRLDSEYKTKLISRLKKIKLINPSKISNLQSTVELVLGNDSSKFYSFSPEGQLFNIFSKSNVKEGMQKVYEEDIHDSDDDDYSIEDVCKAASEKVRQEELRKKQSIVTKSYDVTNKESSVPPNDETIKKTDIVTPTQNVDSFQFSNNENSASINRNHPTSNLEDSFQPNKVFHYDNREPPIHNQLQRPLSSNNHPGGDNNPVNYYDRNDYNKQSINHHMNNPSLQREHSFQNSYNSYSNNPVNQWNDRNMSFPEEDRNLRFSPNNRDARLDIRFPQNDRYTRFPHSDQDVKYPHIDRDVKFPNNNRDTRFFPQNDKVEMFPQDNRDLKFQGSHLSRQFTSNQKLYPPQGFGQNNPREFRN